jgi:hypothetical protein
MSNTTKESVFKAHIWSLAARICQSPFLLIVICLLCFDATITGIIPVAFPEWYISQFPSADRHCAKMLNYLSNSADPSVVLMGSSLLLSPSQKTDLDTDKIGQSSFANDYDQAEYFQKQFQSKTGVQVDVKNLAMRGCMASDYGLILKRLWQCNKKPKLVVCVTAPAEFMSNDQPVVEETYVHQALLNSKFWQTNPPLEVAGNKLEKLAAPHNLEAIEHFLGYCKQELSLYLSDKSGHPIDMYNAVKKMHNETIASAGSWCAQQPLPSLTNTLADLKQFKQRYQPPNYKLFEAHARNFADMMRFSHEQGIPLVVVNMPITGPNKALIDKGLLRRYYDLMSETARANQIPYLNIDESNSYQIADFSDSTHLGLQGGRKFFAQLAQDLVKKTDLSAIEQTGKQL